MEGEHKMTKRYTAADFANAKFAEHPTGRVAARNGDDPHYVWVIGENGRVSDHCMALADWTPVTPAATITDSDVENLCDPYLYNNDAYLDGFIQGFQAAGGTILDDPEPADEELLAGIIRGIDDWQSITSPELLAKYINTAGVTPPKEDT